MADGDRVVAAAHDCIRKLDEILEILSAPIVIEIRPGKPAQARRRPRRAATKRRRWTRFEDAQLRRDYPMTPAHEIAARLGRAPGSVHQRAAAIGISKSPEFKRRQGRELAAHPAARAQRYEKGHNGGHGFKKGHRHGRATRFKKGQRPHTWKPIGTERINADGYRERKVTETGCPPRDWRPIHLLMWQEANGPVPDGHAVVFRNGDKTDIRLENLECITRAELMARNTVHNLPKPLAELVQLRGALTRKINEAERRVACRKG